MCPDQMSTDQMSTDQMSTDRRDASRPDSLTDLLGGWRASTDATLPPVGFVLGWLLGARSIGWGVAAAVAVSVVLAGYRLARGTRPRAVLLGLLGVAIASMIALHT